MPCAQHRLRNVYSYIEAHVLSTVFIQSICRKHPRLPVSICSLLLLSSIDATTGMDKMLNETILFSFLLYTTITSFMTAFFPFLPFSSLLIVLIVTQWENQNTAILGQIVELISSKYAVVLSVQWRDRNSEQDLKVIFYQEISIECVLCLHAAN